MSKGYRGSIGNKDCIVDNCRLDNCRLGVGNFVIHFKHENDTPENTYKYVYKIIGVGVDADTSERKMVYQELLKDGSKIWIRDEQDFLSEVDKKKYPNIHQKYRFEKLRYEDALEISTRRKTLE